jgi:hypothetical protein
MDTVGGGGGFAAGGGDGGGAVDMLLMIVGDGLLFDEREDLARQSGSKSCQTMRDL